MSGVIRDEIQLRRKDSARCPCRGHGSPGVEQRRPAHGKAGKHRACKGSRLRVLNPLRSLREIFNIFLLHKGPEMCLVL